MSDPLDKQEGSSLETNSQSLSAWSYPNDGSSRDLRIDFLRGLAILSLVINHVEIFSWFNLLTWERLGVVSGAEGFVILAGVVLGSVYRKRIIKQGWSASAEGLINRALLLYRVDVFIIVSIALLSLIPLLDVSGAMTFINRGSGEVYSLYPRVDAPWYVALSQILLLQCGPHQVQILGLYTVLIFITPIVLWVFSKHRPFVILSICWILYFKNWADPSSPTGAQFEYGFPVLTWQLIYFHGLAYGYYKQEITAWLTGTRRRVALFLSYLLFFSFIAFTLNNPYPALPPWARIELLNPDTFHHIYNLYFQKNTLGVLRLLNYLVFLVVGYHIMTLFWTPIKKGLGWFFIPIGQASLYVFILHLYLLLAIYNVPVFSELIPDYRSGNIWVNSLGHGAILMILWLMVRFEVAYKWIPR
jgi:hypothetical protein